MGDGHRVTPLEQRRNHGYPGKVIDQVSRHCCRQTAAKDVAPVPAKTPRKSQGHHSNRPVTALLSLGEAARENQHGFVGTGVTARSPHHGEAIADLVTHLIEAGMDYYFLKPLKQAEVGFVAEQSARLGISGQSSSSFGQSQIHHPHGPHNCWWLPPISARLPFRDSSRYGFPAVHPGNRNRCHARTVPPPNAWRASLTLTRLASHMLSTAAATTINDQSAMRRVRTLKGTLRH